MIDFSTDLNTNYLIVNLPPVSKMLYGTCVRWLTENIGPQHGDWMLIYPRVIISKEYGEEATAFKLKFGV